MDCKKIREEFIEYLEGSLSRGRHETFEKHLADCRECKKEFEAFKALTEKVAKHLESQASSLNPPAML
ncbi:MAG TPA: zf-HC2 domain-containing protein [Caldisericia bacterium]|nr:zf-HC2 domain-containing protein [Caldisericia bacterium]